MARGLLSRWRCRRLRGALVDLVTGEVAAADRSRLDQHLGTCASCRKDVHALRDLPSRLRRTVDRRPEDWRRQRDAIMAAVRARPAIDARPQLAPRLAWSTAVVTVATVIAAVWLRRPEVAAPPDVATAAAVERLDHATLLAVVELVTTVRSDEPRGSARDPLADLAPHDLEGIAALLGAEPWGAEL
jgi:anti-sigma factor RsiW